ncbi:unnamed protein product [Didymodactylos carnosus]|uniref:Uncharacterized protein n=1 Tax=Didymodactylos carnosus TaxID=1234261 RepID=A0A816E9Q6_9BILA|nr:unnamed protein product [Didymodactylos carnosus]CAF4562522.1 unnamed protein product [Didymodactylos carnosus]
MIVRLPGQLKVGRIRSFHHFEPLNDTHIRCKITSTTAEFDDFDMRSKRYNKLKQIKPILKIKDVNVNDFIIVEHDCCWWLCKVLEINFNLKELNISLLHPPGPKTTFKFPQRSHNMDIELGTIVCLLLVPPNTTSRGNYSITTKQLEEIEEIFADY